MLTRHFSKLSGIAQSTSECLSRLRPTVFTPRASYSAKPESGENGGEKVVEVAFKDSKGIRINGSSYLSSVRSQLGVNEDGEFSLPSKAVESLVAEYDSVQGESKDWKDKYQRALAETENVRRRGIKQVDDAKDFAIQGFCKDLLEVADILELAVNSVKEDTLKDGGKPLKDLFDGVAMTKTVLLKTFAKHGLKPVSPQGEKFDPNLHEAVFQLPASQAKTEVGNIAVVTKIGYSLKERPIRPAQVGVAIDG